MVLTTEEKVYGLSLIWKEAEYNFRIGADWTGSIGIRLTGRRWLT